jgi:hypothetical protein
MYFKKTRYFKHKNIYEMQPYRFKYVFTHLELCTPVATNFELMTKFTALNLCQVCILMTTFNFKLDSAFWLVNPAYLSSHLSNE